MEPTHWQISAHRQQQDTTISVCCDQWTNKEACISVLHKRHQLKAWFIISSVPLLPIKDSDGDKETPQLAGSKLIKHDNQRRVSESHQATAQSTSRRVLLKDISKPAKFNNHYIYIIQCWQANVVNPTLTPPLAFRFRLQSWMSDSVNRQTLYLESLFDEQLQRFYDIMKIFMWPCTSAQIGQRVRLNTVNKVFSGNFRKTALSGFGSGQFDLYANFKSLHADHGQPLAGLNSNNCLKCKHC